MAFTKVGPKYQVVIPKEAREAIGIRAGDLVEATVTKEGIVLRPKEVVDKRLDAKIRKRLEAAEAAAKEGRVLGPFSTAGTAMRALKQRARARRHN
jgi:AbrB family looped-hinge helix DNA binding protein